MLLGSHPSASRTTPRVASLFMVQILGLGPSNGSDLVWFTWEWGWTRQVFWDAISRFTSLIFSKKKKKSFHPSNLQIHENHKFADCWTEKKQNSFYKICSITKHRNSCSSPIWSLRSAWILLPNAPLEIDFYWRSDLNPETWSGGGLSLPYKSLRSMKAHVQ